MLVPVATSHLDLWAVEVVLYLAEREDKPAMIVMTRNRAGTRLAADVAATSCNNNGCCNTGPLTGNGRDHCPKSHALDGNEDQWTLMISNL